MIKDINVAQNQEKFAERVNIKSEYTKFYKNQKTSPISEVLYLYTKFYRCKFFASILIVA